ncbi:hypothetical protein B0T10DRAFT_284016 [Thelonectria olida]|uniref:rRNA biogenesis protein RRP36 n=1 Tax=Thelonectria olida TaxID=1576542 RepID=A0A9P8W9V1_9HYPO|nr:hypothetical protein B0T10DRAFT_284016 [Thelonectria olida]
MALNKRKIGSTGLQRRVRPRREDDWEMNSADNQSSSSDDDEIEERSSRRPNPGDDDSEEDDEDDSEAESGSNEDSEDDDNEEPAAPKVDLSSISFGALAKAQASLPPSKRRSKSAPTPADDDDDDDDRQPLPRQSSSRKDDPKPKRSSKHAPQEQSSKRPVRRGRDFVPDDTQPRRQQYRDPRFDPLVGRLDEEKAHKNYAFLDEYRDKEMADLRVQIKKTKNLTEKERLKRELLSMESKKKSRVRKEEEQNLLKEHRKREKDLVAQGKTPFYLKKSEQKKQLLTERYASMSKGQVDRAIERKRKKYAGKEKKEMDYLQRRSRS